MEPEKEQIEAVIKRKMGATARKKKFCLERVYSAKSLVGASQTKSPAGASPAKSLVGASEH